MTCGILSRIRYFNIISSRGKLYNRKRISRVNELEQRELSGVQSSWKELAYLSYGKKTIEHRNKLGEELSILRNVLENDDGIAKNLGHLEIIGIGSSAVGTSTTSSDLDVLIVPYANDPDTGRRYEFDMSMRSVFFKVDVHHCLSRALQNGGIIKQEPLIFSDNEAKVPIIQGITQHGVPFDIQIGRVHRIYSNNFVRLAFQLDPRQILVYHWLREQVEHCRLFGGSNRLFTAFHLYMLVIHFAQATEILPKLMDEYALHLSEEFCHWTNLVKNFRTEKRVVTPLYTTEEVEKWAPVLIDQFIEYYGQIDFTKTKFNVGNGCSVARSTDNLLLIEPFSDPDVGVCRVSNGATLMNVFCAKLVKNRYE